jgi:hypothetical protein
MVLLSMSLFILFIGICPIYLLEFIKSFIFQYLTMKRFSHYYKNYLSKYDLTGKHNKTDILTVLKLNSIILNIPLIQFMSLIINFSNSEGFISKTEIKLFFISYLQHELKLTYT